MAQCDRKETAVPKGSVALLAPLALALLALPGSSAGGAAPPPLFSHPPTDLALVAGIVPLGSASPASGHIRPVDHMYLRYQRPASGGADRLPVYAMAAGRLVMATRTRSDEIPDTDYALWIQHDEGVTVELQHLHQLATALRRHLARAPAGAWIEVRDGFEAMFLGQLGAPAPLRVRAGQTVGWTKSWSHAWDVGVSDPRVEAALEAEGPLRYPGLVDLAAAVGVELERPPFPGHPTRNAACFLDYLAPALRAAWTQKLLSTPKSCGRAGWDLAGRLRGTWFNAAVDTAQPPPVLELEWAALSIVPDALRPGTHVQIALATGHPLAALDPTGAHPQLRRAFLVAADARAAARANPNPARVSRRTGVVCYDLQYQGPGGAAYNLVLFRLASARRLLVAFDPTQRAAPGCAAAPAAPVGGWTATYVR
jgi:hypothetical protein